MVMMIRYNKGCRKKSDGACDLAPQLLSFVPQPGIKVHPTTIVRYEKNTQIGTVARPSDAACHHHHKVGPQGRIRFDDIRGCASSKGRLPLETADTAFQPA